MMIEKCFFVSDKLVTKVTLNGTDHMFSPLEETNKGSAHPALNHGRVQNKPLFFSIPLKNDSIEHTNLFFYCTNSAVYCFFLTCMAKKRKEKKKSLIPVKSKMTSQHRRHIPAFTARPA